MERAVITHRVWMWSRVQLHGIELIQLPVNEGGPKIDGVYVILPHGWCAHVILAEVSIADFIDLEGAVGRFKELEFSDARRPYEARHELTRLYVYSQDVIWKYVRMGALWDARLMKELGEELFVGVMKMIAG